MSFFTNFINNLWKTALSYGVSPKIFVGLYLVTWPLWYLTMWWVLKGWHNKDRKKMKQSVWLNRVVTIAPYAYIMVAGGRSMPLTWWIFTLGLPIVTTSLFLHKIKNEEWLEKWWVTYKNVISKILKKRSG